MRGNPSGQGAALALLARAAGEFGDAERFDRAINGYRDLLDRHPGGGLLFNPFTFREIELRGLLATGRPGEAVRIVGMPKVDAAPAAPQWQIIERVTSGRVLLEAGEQHGAVEAFRTALHSAEAHRLPHQIQRAIRAAESGDLREVAADGAAALQRLRDSLGPPAVGA